MHSYLVYKCVYHHITYASQQICRINIDIYTLYIYLVSFAVYVYIYISLSIHIYTHFAIYIFSCIIYGICHVFINHILTKVYHPFTIFEYMNIYHSCVYPKYNVYIIYIHRINTYIICTIYNMCAYIYR